MSTINSKNSPVTPCLVNPCVVLVREDIVSSEAGELFLLAGDALIGELDSEGNMPFPNVYSRVTSTQEFLEIVAREGDLFHLDGSDIRVDVYKF